MSKKELRKKLEAEIGRTIADLLKKINSDAATRSAKAIREASKSIAKKFVKNSQSSKSAPVKRVIGKPAIKKADIPVKHVKALTKSKK